MSFDWKTFVTLAEWLLNPPTPPPPQATAQSTGGVAAPSPPVAQSPPQEAAQRSAISRAYYGAFRTARDLVEKRNMYSPNGDGKDHYGVINTCKNHTGIAFRHVGAELERLYRSRCRADYDAVVNNVAAEGTEATKRARKVLTYLASL